MDRKAHWDRVYTTKASAEVSWFQTDPTISLQLLEGAGLTAATRRRREMLSEWQIYLVVAASGIVVVRELVDMAEDVMRWLARSDR